MSKEFPIRNGVCQGDVLAPTLFNLYFDAIYHLHGYAKAPRAWTDILHHPKGELVGKRKRMLCQTLIPDLEYADDMCLISDSVNGKGKGKGFLL